MYKNQNNLVSCGYNDTFIKSKYSVFVIKILNNDKVLEQIYFYKYTKKYMNGDMNLYMWIKDINSYLIPKTNKNYSICYQMLIDRTKNLTEDNIKFYIDNDFDNLEFFDGAKIKIIILKWLNKYNVFK